MPKYLFSRCMDRIPMAGKLWYRDYDHTRPLQRLADTWDWLVFRFTILFPDHWYDQND